MVYAVWAVLLVVIIGALVLGRWAHAFVAAVALLGSLVPPAMAARTGVRLPYTFVIFITLFMFGTLFLGEALDFYEEFWWWDIALHGLSAVGLGLAGFLLIFYLFEGDRYAAPAWAVSFFSWCFAVAVGAIWEVFEYLVDYTLGTNMQKSGLPDTMGDLMVDALGALIGALAGFFYMLGRGSDGPLISAIREFIKLNRRHFRRADLD